MSRLPASENLSTVAAAELLGIHPETLRDWARRGIVPIAGRVGTGPRPKYRFRRAELLRWLAGDGPGKEGPVGPTAEKLSPAS